MLLPLIEEQRKENKAKQSIFVYKKAVLQPLSYGN